MIPDKPFIREILGDQISVELLSISDLQKCITTCVYFGLSSTLFVEELMWRITENQGLVSAYLDQNPSELDPKGNPTLQTLSFRTEIEEPLRSELVQKVEQKLDRDKLIQMGARFLKCSYVEIARGGNLRLFKWTHLRWKAYEHTSDYPIPYYTWNPRCAAAAAEGGHLEVLQYLVQCGCPIDWTTTVAAVRGHHSSGKDAEIYDVIGSDIRNDSNLQCLKYLHEIECPWNVETSRIASQSGCLECLKYLRANRCSWDIYSCIGAATKGKTIGHLECLKYVHENGAFWDKDICTSAASEGNLLYIKYLHQNRCPWNEETCSSAAEGGHIDCLKYLHENGCPWNKYACWRAASGGTAAHLDCLQYLHENGCPWDEETCSRAAREGRLDCLQYLHENGCPWDEETCSSAAYKNHFECLKYAHENGCPWNEALYKSIHRDDQPECLRYALDNGCPAHPDTVRNVHRPRAPRRWRPEPGRTNFSSRNIHYQAQINMDTREFMPPTLQDIKRLFPQNIPNIILQSK